MPGPLDDQIMNSAQTMEHPPLVQKPFLMDLCDGSEMRLPNALSTMRSESSNLRRTELSVEPFLLRDYSVDQDAHRSLDPYVKEEESQRARFSGHQALGAVHHQTPGIENGTAQVRSPSASKRLELEASPSPRFSYVISPLKRNNEQDAPRRSDEVSPMNVESATLNRILEFDASVTNMLSRAPSATSEKDSHAEKVYQTFHTARKMTSISPSFTPLPPPFTPPLFSNSRTSQEASVNPLTEDPQTMLQHLFFPHTVQAGLPSTAMFPVPPSSFMTGTRPYSFPGPYNLLNSSYPWGGMMLPNKIEKKQEFVEIKNPTCDKCGKVVINSDYKSHNKLCAGKICNRCRVAVTGSYEEHKLQCSMRMCDRCGMIPTESFAEHNKLCKSALRLHISEPRHPIRPITADASRCTEDISKNVAHRALPNEVIESKNFTSTAQRSSENEGKKKERLVTCPICMALVPPMDLEENENGIRKHDNSCGNVCSYCCRIYDGSIEVHFGRCLQYIRDQIQSMKS